MPNSHASTGSDAAPREPQGYEPPTCEVVCLACEISAYAPEEDLPLF